MYELQHLQTFKIMHWRLCQLCASTRKTRPISWEQTCDDFIKYENIFFEFFKILAQDPVGT